MRAQQSARIALLEVFSREVCLLRGQAMLRLIAPRPWGISKRLLLQKPNQDQAFSHLQPGAHQWVPNSEESLMSDEQAETSNAQHRMRQALHVSTQQKAVLVDELGGVERDGFAAEFAEELSHGERRQHCY